MTANLCIKHFPEPVIYISEEPMCKKCIPEYLEKMKKEKGENVEETKQEQQADMLTQMFGTPQMNMYSAERSLINNCIIKLDDFRGDFRYINEEIEDRVKESTDNLTSLPELMCQIFSTCKNSVSAQKNLFLTELDDIINKQ
jgi:hypothetical protein